MSKAKLTANVIASPPVNFLLKPLKTDFKTLFTALAKGAGHTALGKWEELGNDAVDALSALGLTTEPGELATLLIRRSLIRAAFSLIGDSADHISTSSVNEPEIGQQFELTFVENEIPIDRKFLDRPADLAILPITQNILHKWLVLRGVSEAAAMAISQRLPSYFVYALNEEWRLNAKSYLPLKEALDTPFARASDREWAWSSYSALLIRRVEESLFDEPFSLRQLFVPLNAYYVDDAENTASLPDTRRPDRIGRRVVVSLRSEIEKWLRANESSDAIRVLSGGPGSGKSSFAKILAAELAKQSMKILFIPLHLIDPSKALVDEVGHFVKEEGILANNPLDPDSPEPKLLIIFDGLDELASQGKAAAETARAFIREVERTVEKRNAQAARLQIIISGRELVVQENESEFRRRRQILYLLPYRVEQQPDRSEAPFHDPDELLSGDLRNEWWRKYGALTGRTYNVLPKDLQRTDLDEVTAQPLLNYLVALSYTRGAIDFSRGVNLNSIYGDLVAAVYARGYEKHRPHASVRHMSEPDFFRILEEIGLAAWHGDGRSTTVGEIAEHCQSSGVARLLDAFQEGAKAGVTRLLTAFFFRQQGRRTSGDATFVFTHKSFGEYLAARRIIRATERIVRELEARDRSPDEGWDERDALKYWVQVCGPSPVSRYLYTFLGNEMQLRLSVAVRWQQRLTKLFSYVLRFGVPIELLQLSNFKQELFQARNSEEALLVVLNCCAKQTRQQSKLDITEPTSFGAWFRRIQGQRIGPQPALAAECLSFLSLNGSIMEILDLYGCNLEHADLTEVSAVYSCFAYADLRGTCLRSATLMYANLERAKLQNADLRKAHLREANLTEANLRGADLRGANLLGADLSGADLTDARVDTARFSAATFARQYMRSERSKIELLEVRGLEMAKGVAKAKHLDTTFGLQSRSVMSNFPETDLNSLVQNDQLTADEELESGSDEPHAP